MQKLVLFALVCLLSLRASAEPKRGGTFKFNLRVAPASLNPITAHDNYSLEPMHWMVETLLTRDENTYAWEPRLAESYKLSADQRTITFELRKEAKFHNGEPLTAEDVRFSFDVYAMNLYKTAAESEEFKIIDRIEVLGPHTIRFHLTTTRFDNLEFLASKPIVPKSIYGQTPLPANINKVVIGTGPYRLKEYINNQRLILEANPDWWGRNLAQFNGRFNFSQIIARISIDEESNLLMLEKGDLDFAYMKPESFRDRTKKAPWGRTVIAERAKHLGIYTWQSSLFWNLRLKLFKDVRTRRAMQLLFNRADFNNKMRDGSAILATGPWHRLSEYADPSVEPVAFDPAAAGKLLKDAGWKDTDNDGVLDQVIDGKKQDFRFTVLLSGRDPEKYMVAYQHDLKKAGIDLQVQIADWSLFMKKLDELDYEAYVVGRGNPGVVDFNPFNSWTAGSMGKYGANNIGYTNAEVEKILDRAQLETNREKRIKLLRSAYKKIAEDQSQLYWFSDPEQFYGRTGRVKAPKPYLKYGMGFDTWWIE